MSQLALAVSKFTQPLLGVVRRLCARIRRDVYTEIRMDGRPSKLQMRGGEGEIEREGGRGKKRGHFEKLEAGTCQTASLDSLSLSRSPFLSLSLFLILAFCDPLVTPANDLSPGPNPAMAGALI